MRKEIILALASILTLGCTESTVPERPIEATSVEPTGIEVSGDAAAFSYAIEGEWKTSAAAIQAVSLGTRGDLCISLQLVNITSKPQTIWRKHLMLDLDGKLSATPTNIYRADRRGVKYITIEPHKTATVLLYFQDAFGQAFTNWRNTTPDSNATYSIDIRLCSRDYLYGCDLYAHHADTEGWTTR